MSMECFINITNKIVTLFASLFKGESASTEIFSNFVKLAILKHFPKIMRKVKKDTLQEKHKGHPLIVGMMSLGSFSRNIILYTLMSVFLSMSSGI
uniref:Uncharacterized protein n=1 Tax=Lepeophtheirus salmonis TaxID=72036 RepID=A0A0K2SZX5_LEPSM